MRIGIVPDLNPGSGGTYQYSITILDALRKWAESDACDDAFVVFAADLRHPALAGLHPPRWTVLPFPVLAKSPLQQRLDGLRRIVGEGRHRDGWRWLRRRLSARVRRIDPDIVKFRPDINRVFRDCGVELMLYPAPGRLPFEAGVPYVMAIHDLQHRLQPHFPEVSSDGEWESREYCFRNGSRYATLLLADSEVGKEDILGCYAPYGVTEDRVKILPFLPASYLPVDVPASDRHRVRTVYALPERYLFYPAQFWTHKNHVLIVRALAVLKRARGLTIPAVFCGSHSGEVRERVFREVMALARRSELASDVHYLGYAPDSDMAGLYAGATALVMPTFFGPTNIPVMEAWALGCPVVTSDIRGIREHVGDAALLVDPRSAEALADAIERVWTDERLRATLVERGRARLRAYTPEHFRRRLADILEEAKLRVRSEPSRLASLAAIR
jgi:glycosyltransferase involved in cell wall biosynthesis